MIEKMSEDIWEYECGEAVDLLLQEFRLLLAHKDDMINLFLLMLYEQEKSLGLFLSPRRTVYP